MKRFIFLLLVPLCLTCPRTQAGDLVLLAEGKSNYQIIVPDSVPSPVIRECLAQTARLVQIAFKANGVEIPVVAEGQRDPKRPGIYLGNTDFARANGVNVTLLKGWG